MQLSTAQISSLYEASISQSLIAFFRLLYCHNEEFLFQMEYIFSELPNENIGLICGELYTRVMNYDWTLIIESGQAATGFVEIYSKTAGKNAVAILTSLPKFDLNKQAVTLTLLLEGKKGDWTDGEISSVFHDMQEYIQSTPPKTFYLKKIENFQYGSH